MNSILSFLIFTVFFFSSCKLILNNPSDPGSRDFFLTQVLNAWLRNSCTAKTDFRKTYGPGTSNTFASDLLVLPDGNFLVFGLTNDYLIPGVSQGTVSSFSGSVGVSLNAFLMKVSGLDGEILWVDYLGEKVFFQSRK